MGRMTPLEFEQNAEPRTGSQGKDRDQDMEELHNDVLGNHLTPEPWHLAFPLGRTRRVAPQWCEILRETSGHLGRPGPVAAAVLTNPHT